MAVPAGPGKDNAGVRMGNVSYLRTSPVTDTRGIVAGRIGYGSPYALSHAFEREFGVTPGWYRAQAAGRSAPAGAGALTPHRVRTPTAAGQSR